MTDQLTLDLPVKPALGRADFFVSEANRAAVALLEGWREWPDGKLLIHGPAGAGKSHLAQVFAAVENADRIAGDGARETLLFHLHNMAHAARALGLRAPRSRKPHAGGACRRDRSAG